MARTGWMSLLTGLILASGTVACAQDKPDKPTKAEKAKGEKETGECNDKPEEIQVVAVPKCPVSDEPVNLFVSLATDDGPVYFCCPKCIDKYKGHEKDFADKVSAQRDGLAKLAKVQVTCPVSGKPIDEKAFTEKGGQKVFFCGKDCQGKYEAEPTKYAKKLAASYTYQARCPVMGEDIDPTCFKDFGTQRVYFCCPICIKKLAADPDKYAANLNKQGFKLDVDAVKKAAAEKKDDAKKEDAKKPVQEQSGRMDKP